jgi:hypothetical protein
MFYLFILFISLVFTTIFMVEISINEFIKAHRKIHQIQLTIINNK